MPEKWFWARLEKSKCNVRLDDSPLADVASTKTLNILVNIGFANDMIPFFILKIRKKDTKFI